METPPTQDSSPSNYPRPNLADDRTVLKEVATAQKSVLYCILGQLGLGVLQVVGAVAQLPVLFLVVYALALVVFVFMLVSVYKLANALGLAPVLYIILMFVPCVSLITLLILSQKASQRLQQAGLKVGLLGTDPNSI